MIVLVVNLRVPPAPLAAIGLAGILVRLVGLTLIGGTASLAACAGTVRAMKKAPLARVSAPRETSMPFAVPIGWRPFGERTDRTEALATGLIVAGAAVTRPRARRPSRLSRPARPGSRTARPGSPPPR